jgi:hypothetical protein
MGIAMAWSVPVIEDDGDDWRIGADVLRTAAESQSEPTVLPPTTRHE